MVNQIFFDLGLTLVHNDMPQRYKDVLEDMGYHFTLEQTQTAYHLANKYFMHLRQGDLGKKNDEIISDYHKLVCECLGVEQEWQIFSKLLKNMERPKWKCFDFTLKMLDELNEMGIKTGLISNWDLSCRDVLRQTEISQRLNCIVVSQEEGFEKPDERIFKKALELVNLNPQECLYVGDNYYDDYIGAQKVKIPCVIINYKGKLGIEETDCTVIEKACEVIDLIKNNQLPNIY